MPLTSILDLAHPAIEGHRRASTLMVMLPGAYDTPREFVEHGFVAAVRERRLDVDLQLVDAHVAYYTGQTILDRLRLDVIEPALQQGYGRIWLAGTSIGGMGSLVYAATFPGQIAGVVALAPYLGPRNISADVVRAGGLHAWPRHDQDLPDDATDRRLWCWLKSRVQEPAPADLPDLYWGHGRQDRFAQGHRVVADALPPSRVVTADGGHDWPTWIALWRQLLDRLPWPERS